MTNPEYDGPERRRSTPISTALQSIIELQGEVEDLARAVSENRETTEQAQRKITLGGIMLGLIAILVVISMVIFNQVTVAANSARDTASCLVPDTPCSTRLASEGQSNLVRNLKFQTCYFRTEIERRTLDRAIACAQFAYPNIKNIADQLREVP